jgi:formate hydrogenlyase transcriptional activator
MIARDRLQPYRVALEASPTAVLVADAAGTIVFVNTRLATIFGYGSDELVGQSVDVLGPEVAVTLRQVQPPPDPKAPDTRPAGQGRVLAGRHKDGSSVDVEIEMAPIVSDQETLLQASIIDVTRHRQRENTWRAAMESQLAFESLLAKFSLQCINLPDEEVPAAIRDVLGILGDGLALDRCSFFRIAPDGVLFGLVIWTAPDIATVQGPLPGHELFPWALSELLAGRRVSFSSLEEVPDERDRAGLSGIGTRSAVYLPLPVKERIAGAVGFSSVRETRHWSQDALHRLQVVASVFAQVLARIERDDAVRKVYAEVARLKEEAQAENGYLRREERDRAGLTRIVGQSPAFLQVMEQIRQVAPTDSTVLLLGETGTGKELFATHLHELSARHARAMVRVNCAAIPATLIESELFGREKGAFTGALTRQVGRFELADHSTIFLDEIGDLPQEVQVKLLRVLEERTIERLGSPRPITVDTRIIAATHRQLEQRVQEGGFREDLYYRLNVFPIQVPTLRERTEDIELLVWRFVEEFSRAFGKRVGTIDEDSLAALRQYHWPGNIRELRNTVERAMIVATGRRLTITLPHATASSPRRSVKLVEVEREHIRGVLESTRWRIRGAGGAADRLGLRPTTLETRMAKLGIRRPKETERGCA